MNKKINTRKDLREYIACDRQLYPRVSTFRKRFIQMFTSNPINYQNDIWKYIFYLRHSEYHYNNSIKDGHRGIKAIYHSAICSYYFARLRKLSYTTGFQIPPNTVGPGLLIYHYGTIIINPKASIGHHATLYPGVIIGHKDDGTPAPVIGDHVFIGSGSKVIGPVTIGSHATIAPNAVVVHNVPDYTTVAGVPAVIISTKSAIDSNHTPL